MRLGIRGKVALVTGGATGIGKAIVKQLTREGVIVCYTARDLGVDVTKDSHRKKIFKHMEGVDIIVNNVGSDLGIKDPYCSIEDWISVFNVNLLSHIAINNNYIPYMKKKGWGRIVNISAGSAMENNGAVPYCCSKAALTAYSRCMGRVLAKDGIVMSAVQPGIVVTERGHWNPETIKTEHAKKYLEERTVLKRFGTPKEIAPMVVLLCSELASFCQGAIVPVDGGQAKHYFNYK